MRVLLLNQYYAPDLAPTGQLASELAEGLVQAGFDVTAIASRGAYLGGRYLAARDIRGGVDVRRLMATSFGKGTILSRAVDYATFYAAASLHLARQDEIDVVVAMTTPPLIAGAGLMAKMRHGSALVYWVQDLYPEVAVAFGALSEGSLAHRAMQGLSRRVLRAADRVVVLGQAMAEQVEAAGAVRDTIRVIPNWMDGSLVGPGESRSSSLREEFARDARFLVMYSGNIGRAHDVRTIINAVRRLRDRGDIAFAFVGDGARKRELQAGLQGLKNVRFARYQPRQNLAESLTAADAHLVTLAPEAGGLLEPSKAVGAMAAGKPIIFVGPAVADLALTIQAERCGKLVANGDAQALATEIAALADHENVVNEMGRRARLVFERKFERRIGVQQFTKVVVEACTRTSKKRHGAARGL